MALTALEIEAIFRIQDLATPAFKRIADEARVLSRDLKAIAADINTSFNATFSAMNIGVTSQITQVDALAAAWARVGAAAKAAGVVAAPAAAIGGATPRNLLGGHGSSNSVHVSSPSTPLPGGHALFRGSNAAMVGAGALGYGMFEGFKMGDVLSRGLANVFPEGNPADRAAKQKQLEANKPR
jgi:hypothetical protein